MVYVLPFNFVTSFPKHAKIGGEASLRRPFFRNRQAVLKTPPSRVTAKFRTLQFRAVSSSRLYCSQRPSYGRDKSIDAACGRSANHRLSQTPLINCGSNIANYHELSRKILNFRRRRSRSPRRTDRQNNRQRRQTPRRRQWSPKSLLRPHPFRHAK